MSYVSVPIAQLLCVLFLFASHASCQESKNAARQSQQEIDEEVESIVQAAQDLMAEGKQYFALRKLKRGTKGRPSDAVLWLERASIYESLDKIEKMRIELDRATKADPTSPETFANAGWMLREVDMDAAISLLSKAIELDPKYMPGYGFRSMLLIVKNDVEAALRDAETAVSLDPTNPLMIGVKANAYLHKGLYDEAIENYSKSIEIEPFIQSFYDRAYCWRQKGELEKAVADYTTAIQMTSEQMEHDHVEAICERGQAWQELGEFEKAIDDFELCDKLDPDDPQANLQLAWIFATCPDEKIRNGKRALKIAGELCDPATCQISEPLNALAAAHAELDNFEKAIELQNRANDLCYFAPDFRAKGIRRLKTLESRSPIREANVPLNILNRHLQKLVRRIELGEAIEVPAEILARNYLHMYTLRQLIPFAKSGGNVGSTLDGLPIELTSELAEENAKLIDERISVYKQAIQQRTYKKLRPSYSVALEGDCEGWGISDSPILLEQDSFELKITQDSVRHVGVVVESTVVFRHDGNTDVVVSGKSIGDQIIFLTPKEPGIFLQAKQECKATLSPAEIAGTEWAWAYLGRANAELSYNESAAALHDIDAALALDSSIPSFWLRRAFTLATCPDENVRDGKQAVEAALRAQKLLDTNDNPDLFAVLAVAYAESGDFKTAIDFQKKALEIAEDYKKPSLSERLRLFEANKPFRQ